MMQQQSLSTIAETQTLLGAIVCLLDCPACIVTDGELIVSQNDHWGAMAGESPDEPDGELAGECAEVSSPAVALVDCLQNISPAEEMLSALRSGSQSSGTITVASDMAPGFKALDGRAHTYQLSWHQIVETATGKTLAFVMLKNAYPSEHKDTLAEEQQVLINQLLVRQTLIEEAERRRLSTTLHDGIVQDLAQLYNELSSKAYSAVDTSSVKTKVAELIEQARSLVFEFSPPVLNDLGFHPAMEWLAEFIGEKYDANITVMPCDDKPDLAKDVQIILFRAVRELTVNAAKHAPGADIELSCSTENDTVIVVVRDNGAGFDVGCSNNASDGPHNFGLLSIEQQIHGIAGVFNLVSSPADGTVATITLPIDQSESSTDD